MNEVSEIIKGKLFLTGSKGASSFFTLEELEIQAIVNLSQKSNKFEDKFKYLRVDIRDSEEQNITKYFDEVLKFIDDNGVVLVYCHGGVSRSSSFVIAYLIKYRNMSLKDALSHVYSIRRIIQPNEGFMNQLISYFQCDSLTIEDYKVFCIKKIAKSKLKGKNDVDESIINLLKKYQYSVNVALRHIQEIL